MKKNALLFLATVIMAAISIGFCHLLLVVIGDYYYRVFFVVFNIFLCLWYWIMRNQKLWAIAFGVNALLFIYISLMYATQSNASA